MTIRLSVVEVSHLEKILSCKEIQKIVLLKPDFFEEEMWGLDLYRDGTAYKFTKSSLEQVIKEASVCIYDVGWD